MSQVIEPNETLPPSKDNWATQMEALTDEQGYFQPIGDKHFALFIDESPSLLVCFETLENVLGRGDQMPLGYDLAKSQGWSMLTIVADGETWFRDPAVYSFFDRQVDDAFFEDFDNVLFFGEGMGGYAACAFAVNAPGTQVLALNPRATLDPDVVGWDQRNRSKRRLDFHSRFGYAPDMLDGARQAIVIHDTQIPAEAMHSTLFRAPHVLRLSADYIGEDLASAFSQMNILSPMIEAAMACKLDAVFFAKIFRKRRDFAPYLTALLRKADSQGNLDRQITICLSVVNRLNHGRFAKRLARLQEAKASNNA